MTASWIKADWPATESIVAGTTLRGTDLASIQLQGEPCWLNQVHGSDVVVASAFTTPPAADGATSADQNQICVVRTADCLPILFCTADGSQVAAAHAGWRGLAAGVIENTIAQIDANSKEILVWFGPAISQPSFEVGEEVREVFIAHDQKAATCFLRNARGRWQADLYALARQRLAAVGVTEIYGGGFCTFLDTQRFYSYRRDPDCGRMISFVALNTP